MIKRKNSSSLKNFNSPENRHEKWWGCPSLNPNGFRIYTLYEHDVLKILRKNLQVGTLLSDYIHATGRAINPFIYRGLPSGLIQREFSLYLLKVNFEILMSKSFIRSLWCIACQKKMLR